MKCHFFCDRLQHCFSSASAYQRNPFGLLKFERIMSKKANLPSIKCSPDSYFSVVCHFFLSKNSVLSLSTYLVLFFSLLAELLPSQCRNGPMARLARARMRMSLSINIKNSEKFIRNLGRKLAQICRDELHLYTCFMFFLVVLGP